MGILYSKNIQIKIAKAQDQTISIDTSLAGKLISDFLLISNPTSSRASLALVRESTPAIPLLLNQAVPKKVNWRFLEPSARITDPWPKSSKPIGAAIEIEMHRNPLKPVSITALICIAFRSPFTTILHFGYEASSSYPSIVLSLDQVNNFFYKRQDNQFVWIEKFYQDIFLLPLNQLQQLCYQ